MSEIDEVMESVPRDERVVISAYFNDHVGEGDRGDEDIMCRFDIKDRNAKGQRLVDFAKGWKWL